MTVSVRAEKMQEEENFVVEDSRVLFIQKLLNLIKHPFIQQPGIYKRNQPFVK